MSEYLNINTLIGKTLTKIDGKVGDGSIEFYCSDGSTYQMYHDQCCCESVGLDDIVGNLEDLIGEPILTAEVVSNDEGKKGEWDDSYTWTFYKLSTIKGYVTLKWYGTSNGCYSESVELIKTK